MPTRLPLAEFQAIYSKVPRLCVELLVLNDKKEVLLTLRDIEPAKGLWHLPGGTVLFGESLTDAIQRVAREEIGTKVKVIKLLKPIEFLDPKVTAGGHSISLDYLVEPEGPIVLDNQASEYNYFRQIPENTILEHKEFLRSFLDS